MFIKNLTKEPIGPFTFEGYEFTLPVGVSSIYKPAGKHLVENIYKVESTEPNTGGTPPAISAKSSEWDEVTYAEVRRFKIDAKLIPNRQDLLRLARQRGVSSELLEKMQYDEEQYDNEEIVRIINSIPVSEEVRFADRKEKVTKDVKNNT